MASVQTIWGIDVGRCALKALKLRVSGDNTVEIVASDYIEHPKILSQPDANRHELIASAIEKFLSHHDLSKDQVVVSVPGQHTLSRFTKLPPVAPKRIPDIVKYEADQQIPFDMDDVIWDYQTFDQEDMPDLEVGIFAMKRELLREHLLHFEQAAIEPVAVQSCPLALYNAAYFDGILGEETTVLIDIGAETTDLVIATQAGFWTRTIPIGGNNFTDAAVKAFKLSFSKAESLKRTAETSKYRRQVFQAMRPVFADLVQELQRSIGFYSSTHRDAKMEKIIGAGNAFQLPGLQKYFQQNLGLKVECWESFKKASVAGSAGGEELQDNILSFVVAYGLAVQGLELSKIASNLLPTEIAKQVVWRKKRPAFAAAAACLVLAGGLIWFRQSADSRALAANQADARDVQDPDRDEALQIIENGPSRSLSPRASAVAIRKAGAFFNDLLSDLENDGQMEREETELLIDLQRNKAVVPKIVNLIHESLPRPEGALGSATTQEAYVEALSGAPARGERNEVFIKKLVLQYEADLNTYEWQPIGPVQPSINDPEAEVPGIKIELECITPNQGGPKFIKDAFMDRLQENGRRPGLGFYVDRVYLIDGSKVETVSGSPGASGRTAAGSPLGGGPGGYSRPGSTPAQPVLATVEDPRNLDVVSNEPIKDDWRFEIWAEVILDEFPESEEEDTDFDDSEEEEEGD